MKEKKLMKKIIKRRNHFVPEMYLKSWSYDTSRIMEYRLLVAHEKEYLWKPSPIAGTAKIDNLYVRIENGEETDDFEDMFNHKYESKTKAIIDKICCDSTLSADEWKQIIDFVIVQIVRTPAFYSKILPVMIKIVDNSLEKCMDKLTKIDFESLKDEEYKEMGKVDLPVSIQTIADNNDNECKIVKVSASVGKNLWLWSIENSFVKVLQRLHDFEWSILSSDEKCKWPTSDNPVICLNRYSKDPYDFWGVVGHIGNEIIFPISPYKALYVQIGKVYPRNIKLSFDASKRLKELIVNNAFRSVYCDKKDEEIPQIRPRTVDLKRFQEDRALVEEWYDVYKEQEGDFIRKLD